MPGYDEVAAFIREHPNTQLSYRLTTKIGPIQCMYFDKDENGNKESLYTLWEKYNPNIPMPEPMKRYDPYKATPQNLDWDEYQMMIRGWIQFWGDEDLPVNLRHEKLLHSWIMRMDPPGDNDKGSYATPAILFLMIRGNTAKMPDYIYSRYAYEVVDDKGRTCSWVGYFTKDVENTYNKALANKE